MSEQFRCPVKFDKAEIERLVQIYKENKRGMEKEESALRAGQEIASRNFSKQNLLAIVVWKSQRAKSWAESNSEAEIEDALRLAVDAKTDRAAIAVLMGLRGVGIPMASAILTTIKPKHFTVIDVLALKSLGVVKEPALTIDYYLDYQAFWQREASNRNVELRDFDRALWQNSKSS